MPLYNITRDDLERTVLASAGASIDVLTAKSVVVTLDANIVNLTFPSNPSRDEFPIVFAFDQNASAAKTVTFDATKFRGGLDVTVPTINATLSSRTYVVALWNAKDSIFDIVDAAQRYP